MMVLKKTILIIIIAVNSMIYGMQVDGLSCDVSVLNPQTDNRAVQRQQKTIVRDLKVITRRNPDLLTSTAITANSPFYTFEYNDTARDDNSLTNSVTYYKKGARCIQIHTEEQSDSYLPSQQIVTNEIDGIECKVKSSRKPGRDSVAVTGKIDFNDIDNKALYLSETMSLGLGTISWELPLSEFTTSIGRYKVDRQNDTQSVLKYRDKNLTLAIELETGIIKLSAKNLDLCGLLPDEYILKLGFDGNELEGRASIDGQLPINLLKGYHNSLRLKKVLYSASPYRDGYKRVRCIGEISSRFMGANLSKGFYARVGSFTTSISQMDRVSDSNKYYYSKNMLQQLVVWDICGDIPFGMEVARADIDLDRARFDIIFDVFVGEKDQDCVVFSDEDITLDGTFTLAFDSFYQEVAFQDSRSNFDADNVVRLGTDLWVESILNTSFDNMLAEYFTNSDNKSDNSPFACSYLTDDIVNSIIDFKWPYMGWAAYDSLLGNAVSLSLSKKTDCEFTSERNFDTYKIDHKVSGRVSLQNLYWDVPAENVLVPCEYEFLKAYELIEDREDLYDEDGFVYDELITTSRILFNSWIDREPVFHDLNMVSIDAELAYYSDDEFMLVDIPMNNGKYSCLLLLGQNDTDINELESHIQDIPTLLPELTSGQLAITFPVVDINGSVSAPELKSLEYSDSEYFSNTIKYTSKGSYYSFDINGDGISGYNKASTSLFCKTKVDRVIYNDYISNDDGGASGSAFCSAGVTVISLPFNNPEPDRVFELHYVYKHPMVFLILNNNTGDIIFSGRFTQTTFSTEITQPAQTMD